MFKPFVLKLVPVLAELDDTNLRLHNIVNNDIQIDLS